MEITKEKMTGIELNKTGWQPCKSRVICVEDGPRQQMRKFAEGKLFGECPIVKPNSQFTKFSWDPAKLDAGRYWVSNKILCLLIQIHDSGEIEVVE